VIGNLLLATDQNVVEAIDAARQKADASLEQFVEARKTVAELEALRDLRIALGADVTNVVKLERLREANTA